VKAAEHRDLEVISPTGPRLAVWERGAREAPPIVLLHGLSMTSEQAFGSTSPILAAGFRAVAYDARGHGASDPAARRDEYGYEFLLGDLTRVMDRCGAERAIVAGISMGAHTALRLTLEEPDRVLGLVVISPAYDPDDHPGEDNQAEALALAAGTRSRGAAGFAESMRMPDGFVTDAATQKTAEGFTRRSIERHRDLGALADAIEWSQGRESRPFAGLAELAAIDVPTVVVGSRDDLDTRHPLALARAYAEALAGCEFVCEEEGRTPLGWGGRRLMALIADHARRAHGQL
jgi:pimeloyl-ACP methyl ester carboxylesterase